MNMPMFIIAVALIAASNLSHSATLREQQFQLSIERGPLASVLEQFSHQTGVHIGTEISASKSRANHFGPFVGQARADDAMRELLSGSDLWYAWRDEETIRLFLISAQRTQWSSGVSTAKEASEAIRNLAGVHYETGSCGELMVGPFSSTEPITAEAVWAELIKHHCPVLREPRANIQPGSVDRVTVADQTEHHFSIPTMPRALAFRRIAEQSGLALSYVSNDAQEEQALVSPISGRMSSNEALEHAVRGSVLRVRWVTDDRVSVEPAYTVVTYADMSKCPCNFGLPELRPLQRAHVTVVGSRLPSLQEYSPAPVAEYDRAFIDATGASTIPELLSYLAQQTFSRPRGYRANAAQYFEGRGFGAQYSLVLINDHRAYGSAGDPTTNAFDLNLVPLSAVERIEVALDQPSVLHGTDAIGGTVNIVLDRDLDKRAATLSLGSASGGAEKKLATVSADAQWGNTTAGLVLDHLHRGDLLGVERDRWRDQNYTRYPGGLDYRLRFGVQSVSGDLPGTGAGSAAIVMEPGGPTVQPNGTNMVSALSLAAIVPEQERSSVYGFTSTALGNAELNVGVLLGRQATSLRLLPADLSGLIWGARHPQNPFDTDVVIEALLTGLPPRKQEVESILGRVTIDLSGFFGEWQYSAFAGMQEDRSRAWIINDIDLSVLAHSLMTEDPGAALNVLSARPGEGPLPAGFFLSRRVDASATEGMHFGFNLSGSVPALPAGDAKADVGIAHRQEAAHFDAQLGRLDREISSVFSRLRIPLVSASSISLLRSLELGIGARRDFHSDVRDVTTLQYSLAWQPHTAIQVHAGYSELFRPPSLSERYLPRFSLPIQIYDPQRDEVAPVTFVAGGNPDLHPSEGESVDVGISYQTEEGSRASLTYWQTQIRDRISAVLIQDLVNAQPNDVAERIVRAEPTDADIAADVPGRVLAVDSRRANFGAVRARGVDFSIERTFRTRVGRLTPRIDLTRAWEFQYRDLPAAATPMLDRAGVASPYGTVPSGRATASIQLDAGGLRAFVVARHHTSYQDYSIDQGAASDHRIPAQTLVDIKISKDLGDHLTLSVGVNNVLDDRPPFAQVGGWEGFDQSQGDLVGREAYFDIAGSF